jgi:hypothetical protein
VISSSKEITGLPPVQPWNGTLLAGFFGVLFPRDLLSVVKSPLAEPTIQVIPVTAGNGFSPDRDAEPVIFDQNRILVNVMVPPAFVRGKAILGPVLREIHSGKWFTLTKEMLKALLLQTTCCLSKLGNSAELGGTSRIVYFPNLNGQRYSLFKYVCQEGRCQFSGFCNPEKYGDGIIVANRGDKLELSVFDINAPSRV